MSDEYPVGSRIVDDDGDEWTKGGDGKWSFTESEYGSVRHSLRDVLTFFAPRRGEAAVVTPTGSAYVTQDSGERQEYSSGMVRDVSAGKPRFDLTYASDLPYGDQMLTRFAELMARGAEKYGERNWEQSETAEELRRFQESAIRHFFQWLWGEQDGEDHAAAVYFNIMAAERLERILERP